MTAQPISSDVARMEQLVHEPQFFSLQCLLRGRLPLTSLSFTYLTPGA
jgi:hypothetical protein